MASYARLAASYLITGVLGLWYVLLKLALHGSSRLANHPLHPQSRFLIVIVVVAIAAVVVTIII